MSDQKKGAGHPAITLEATSQLFQHHSQHGKLLGLTEDKFYAKLNHGQGYADGSPLGFIKNTPMRWWGDTWHQASDNPGAQKKHAMADPHKSGAENLKDIQNFIINLLDLAKGYHLQHNVEMEWQCLGAAVHALEDSYSNAHMFRDALHPTDPYSSVEAINVFYWVNSTHDESFDEVPVTNENLERATDQAASSAVAIILALYVAHVDDQPDVTSKLFADEITALLHGDHVVVLDDINSPEYLAERATHATNEISFDKDMPPHFGADTTAPDYTPTNASHDNTSLPDGSTTYTTPDGNQAPAILQHAPTDNNLVSHPTGSSSGNDNISLPDGTTAHSGPDQIPVEVHSQGISPGDSNTSLPDGTTSHSGNENNSAIPPPLNMSPSDSTVSMPDGTTAHIGGDNNTLGLEGQSPPVTPDSKGQIGQHNSDAGAGASSGNSYCYPLDIQAKKGSSPIDHQSRKDNQAGGKFNNWQSRNAWDLVVPYGTPVYAVADGDIGKSFGPLSKNDPLLAGLRLTLQADGNSFYYAHLSKFAEGLHPGSHVKKGELLGYSGRASGVEHLHFAAQNDNSVTMILDHSQLHYDGHDTITDPSPQPAIDHGISITQGDGDNIVAPQEPNPADEKGEAVQMDANPSTTGDVPPNQTPENANAVDQAGHEIAVDGSGISQFSAGGPSNPTEYMMSVDPDISSNLQSGPGDTIHYGADTSGPDTAQQYSSPDQTTPGHDGATVHHVADTTVPNPGHDQFYSSVDQNIPGHDNGTVHHEADTTGPEHGQFYSSVDQNSPGHDSGIAHQGPDTSGPDNTHLYSSVDQNNQGYDNATNHHGPDTSAPDHSGQSQSMPDHSQVDHQQSQIGQHDVAHDDGGNQSMQP